MKQVLIIGADFAPSGLPSALRIRFFANHLSRFGWHPIVLTVDPAGYEHPVDHQNEELVGQSVEVIRCRAWSTSWTRAIGFGNLGLRSLWPLWKAATRICRERRVDLVFLSLPPYFPVVLGRRLRARFGIPYVVDYRDPWVIEDYWRLPAHQRPPKWPLAYYSARLLEPFALKRVSHIVGVSRGTTEAVIARYAHLRPEQTTAIPVGGEPADFEYLRQAGRKNSMFDPEDGLYHLCYTGVFIPAMHETARAIFRAIRQGLDTDPELFGRLRLHFIGTTYSPQPVPQAEALASVEGIAHLFREHPARVPYLEALRVLLDAQGLLAVGSDAPHYTASKLFPYLLAKKPILAVFHSSSSVVSILRSNGRGRTVTYGGETSPLDRTEEIREVLAEMLQGGGYAGSANEAFDAYTTEEMTRRLASVFDRSVVSGGVGAARE